MPRAFLLSCGLLTYFYLIFLYCMTFMEEVDGLTPPRTFAVNTTSLVVSVILMRVSGSFSDCY